MQNPLFYAVVGPTASGKTDLSLALAEQLGAEILCVDSMQVYQGLDIGTAKPSAEEQQRVRHYGLDLVPPLVNFSAAQFEEYAEPILAKAWKEEKPLVLCGGTGLYYRALLEGFFIVPDPDMDLRESLKKRAEAEGREALFNELTQRDPETAAKIHPNDIRRAMRALEIIFQTGKTVSELRASQVKKRWKEAIFYLGIQRDKKNIGYKDRKPYKIDV